MKVLVACEFSGVVREAFKKRGHDAWSCDLLPTEIPGQHIQGDVLQILNQGWDLMIAHPPCTHLAVSGSRHFAKKIADGRQQQGIDLFMSFITDKIDKWAVENPIGIMSRLYRKPDQIIQPFQYGHAYTKSTCLWLKGLPKLLPTNILIKPEQGWENQCFTPDGRYGGFKGNYSGSKLRSRTFQGIADAMADQWG